MNKFIVIGIILITGIIYIERGNIQTVSTPSLKVFKSISKIPKFEILSSKKVAGNQQKQEVQDNIFEKVETVDSLISQHQNLSEPELRQKIKDTKVALYKRHLIEKANAGSISREEKVDLAYYIRLNTALHHILLDKELGG